MRILSATDDCPFCDCAFSAMCYNKKMDNIKFLHTADLHLDSALSSINNTAKASLRRRELTDTFLRMARYADENGFGGFIVAGDMFDVKNASPTVKHQVADIIASAKNTVFFLLGGNHDGKAFDDDFAAMLPSNAIVLKNGVRYERGGVVVAGFDDGVDLQTIPPFDENCFNIVVMHGQTVSGNADGINVKKLADKNIDYLALGHIHSFGQGKIDKRGRYAYCGCPEGRGFDETGEKGFVVFDTQGGVAFKPYAKRQCRELKVDVGGLDSYISQYNAVKREVDAYPCDDIFKIVLIGETEEGVSVDAAVIAEKLNETLFYAKVVDKTSVKLDEQKLQSEISLRGEFFRVVSGLKLTDEDRRAVLKYGFNAMDGLEADND